MIDAEKGRWLTNKSWFIVIGTLAVLYYPVSSFVDKIQAADLHVKAHSGIIEHYNKKIADNDKRVTVVEKDVTAIEKAAIASRLLEKERHVVLVKAINDLNRHLERLNLIADSTSFKIPLTHIN